MNEAQVPSAMRGRIVFDRALGAIPDDDWFDPAHWRNRGDGLELAGGRGGIAFVRTPVGDCALRHYRRGGLAARVSGDRYIWIGASRTRSLREFRLLATLQALGLPVAAPVAARYTRERTTYRADLMTRRIAPARTMAECLKVGDIGPPVAQQIGTVIGRFHTAGVDHADLNAHNILVDVDGSCWLIDFDRGRIRAPQRGWQQKNITRLRRSLDKLGAKRVDGFDVDTWHPLLAAYHAQLANDGRVAASNKASR